MNCLICKANDWVKKQNGMLCDICFNFVPLSSFSESEVDEILKRTTMDIPEELDNGYEAPWG